jgi:hypothetical protein
MAKKQRWTPNLQRVEIEITTACNLRCLNCDRSVRQAPSSEAMTVEQIERFVDESLALDWRWERISLLGGEPSLHPDLDAILGVLDRYRSVRPKTTFRMFSNGYGKRVAAVLARVPAWLEVINTAKTREPPLFSPINMAPADSPEYAHADFSKGCLITEWCGLGLTRYGYYPCGAGASIDRIFGFDIGIKSLAEVTEERMTERLRSLCSLCGHYRAFDQKIEYMKIRDKRVLTEWTREERISPTWEQAYARYKERAPLLRLY